MVLMTIAGSQDLVKAFVFNFASQTCPQAEHVSWHKSCVIGGGSTKDKETYFQ